MTTERRPCSCRRRKFIVSPGFNPKVVKYCIDRDIPVTPGTQTPSEMEQRIEMGLDVVKFFPAEPAVRFEDD